MADSAEWLTTTGQFVFLRCHCGDELRVDRLSWERTGFVVCPSCERLINCGPGLLVETPEERNERLERMKRRRLGLEAPRRALRWRSSPSGLGLGEDPPF